MNIFMTGATGYIGRAVALALRDAGHGVTALVRDRARGKDLEKAGVTLVEGDLDSLLDYRGEIDAAQAVIHAAAPAKNTVELDEKAIHAFTRSHGYRHFLYTSGVWVLGNTGPGVADETTPVSPISLVEWRTTHEKYVLAEARDNFTTTVLRPGCVYGGSQSLLRSWFAAADKGEPLEIVGDGSNRWAMVHLADLADCYRLAVEKKIGGILHGIDDTDASLRQCAEAVVAGSGKRSKIESVPLDKARMKLGPFADALAINQRVASHSTRQRLGWTPRRTFVGSVEEQWREWRGRA